LFTALNFKNSKAALPNKEAYFMSWTYDSIQTKESMSARKLSKNIYFDDHISLLIEAHYKYISPIKDDDVRAKYDKIVLDGHRTVDLEEMWMSVTNDFD